MEFRVNSESTASNGKIVEVCINDQWHETSSTVKTSNTHQSSQDISVVHVIIADSTSVMIEWSAGQHSIPNITNKIVSGYDLSCTASALSDEQIHEVRVFNISMSTTKIQVHGLLPGTAYECCVNAHIHTNTPLDLISSSCVATSTESLQEPIASNDLVIGLGTGLGICSILLMLIIIVLVGCIVSKICTSTCPKRDSTAKGATQRYDIMFNYL